MGNKADIIERCCHYNEVDFVWISNHYDIHLAGLCRVDGRLHRFETNDDTREVTIYRLTRIAKIRWILKKKLFEFCVGYHWTYPNRKQGLNWQYRRPEWLWKIVFVGYYKCNKLFQGIK